MQMNAQSEVAGIIVQWDGKVSNTIFAVYELDIHVEKQIIMEFAKAFSSKRNVLENLLLNDNASYVAYFEVRTQL